MAQDILTIAPLRSSAATTRHVSAPARRRCHVTSIEVTAPRRLDWREQIPQPAAEGLGASLGVVETDWVEGVLPGTNALLRSRDRGGEFGLGRSRGAHHRGLGSRLVFDGCV
jgi:hypothetical protein